MIKTLTAALLLSLALPLCAQERPAKRAGSSPTAAATTAASEAPSDRTELDRTAIVGNRELPKVLYIVPWKKPLPATLSGRPVASVLDEALAPVDRDVFRRHIAYDAQLSLKTTPAPEPAK